jgi:hypothetical protein
MLRKDPGPSNRSGPLVHRAKISPRTENQQNEGSQKHRWLVAAIAASYRYLSDGVRILEKAYSTYDDRNSQ